jgi:hypothetical protein
MQLRPMVLLTKGRRLVIGEMLPGLAFIQEKTWGH